METLVQDYVVGLAFDRNARVALIRKNRPAWQEGLYNGIGGKVEPGEKPLIAMRREFLEETGLLVADWNKVVVVDYGADRVHFYRTEISPTEMSVLKSTTDEEVHVLGAHAAVSGWYSIVSNLAWILPLAAYYKKATYLPMDAVVLESNEENL